MKNKFMAQPTFSGFATHLKIIGLVFLIFLISGCSITFGSSKKSGINPNTDGGVFVSSDRGDTWKQMPLIKTITGNPGSISAFSSYDLAMDPSDSTSIYFGSIASGLYYTYKITDGWNKVEGLSEDLPIKQIAIDPTNKCVIYVASGNKVYKTSDCSRSWSQIYFDDNAQTSITAVAIDHHNGSIVYIGTTRGDVLKSYDGGGSWQPLLRNSGVIEKIVLSPFDSRIVFVSSVGSGTSRSLDAGENWVNLEENLKEFKNSTKFRDLVLTSDKEGGVFLATTYGLLKSDDYGDSWQRIELVTPEKNSIINAVGISPKNSQEIYYITNTTFFRSSDGGVSWTTIKLPSSRAGRKLLVSADNTNIIYMSVISLKK